MKQIKESPNKEHWPRNKVEKVECRKRDLVIRITDWMDDKDEPAYDVEVYIGGIYDWSESQSFTIHEHKAATKCLDLAIKFAQSQIEKIARG